MIHYYYFINFLCFFFDILLFFCFFFFFSSRRRHTRCGRDWSSDVCSSDLRDYILKQIEDNGVANSQMYILEGLTKLRQICNSTALINEEEDYGNYSIKLDTLTETIKEKTGNHKILVFSQFVGMLQLIKNRLESENIVYEYLDGSTRDRQARVDNFQNNSEIRVFLISLKAGGTGLNLTEADYVFLVDPWWNPAVENQAIDRS